MSTAAKTDPNEWAETQFGDSKLGDARRTRRAVDLAAKLAANPDGSVHEICEGDDAAAEGAYRFIENDAVKPEALEEGPFRHTATLCAQASVILAIQDTTTLSYNHSVASQLGDLGGGRGFVVHSTLAVDGETQEVLGLLDQQRWSRPEEDKSRKGKCKKSKEKLPYKERESYKWEKASEQIEHRLESMENVIQIGDRELDIYEYISTRADKGHRFVIRAKHDRKLMTGDERLWDFMNKRPVLGHYEVTIGQRGPQPAELGRPARKGRRARTARMEIRSANVSLLSPVDNKSSVRVNVVYVREKNEDGEESPLEWMLLTTEEVETKRRAKKVVEYYEHRWLIEEYHKAWKTGCAIERRRLQSPANIERIAVITAHVAVRLLQLRWLSYSDPDRPSDVILSQEEWHFLFRSTHEGLPLPESPPSLRWAIEAIAKLGGWRDTKRTGRIGWISLWRGWIRFQERLVGWKMAISQLNNNNSMQEM